VQFVTNLGLGFGVTGNVTWSQANVPSNNYEMPYLSKITYNIVPFYEQGPFQARVSYSYRSKYFTQIGRRASEDFTDAYRQLDFAATYNIGERFSVYGKVLNLLDETYYSFSSVTIAPTSFYKNGRQFMTGVNYKM
jgi:iron complex outermembrane receptor protein